MAINALSIPNNVGPTSYSGFGSGWQNWSQNTVQPVLSNLLGNYEGFVNNAYGNATNGMQQFAQNQMAPAAQSVINNLAGRGMINSSVAGDTMSKTLSNIANQAQGYQAQMAGSQANAMMQLPTFATNLAQFGQYSNSTDNSTPYRIMASLLSGMM